MKGGLVDRERLGDRAMPLRGRSGALRAEPNLRSSQAKPPAAIAIRHERRDEHELLCIMAWRKREHPAWSQHAVTYRVTERPKLRRVR